MTSETTNHPVCGGCGQPATCTHKAGFSVAFYDAKGMPYYHDPDRDCFLCDDCCGHGGEEPCRTIGEYLALARPAAEGGP